MAPSIEGAFLAMGCIYIASALKAGSLSNRGIPGFSLNGLGWPLSKLGIPRPSGVRRCFMIFLLLIIDIKFLHHKW